MPLKDYFDLLEQGESDLSMALRAFPRTPGNGLQRLTNLILIRTVEGSMRKLLGQWWNERNEKHAIAKTAPVLTFLERKNSLQYPLLNCF